MSRVEAKSRARVVVGMLGIAALVGAAVAPASADVVILRSGDHLTGEIQEAELEVATAQGLVRLSAGNVAWATLATVGGDVVVLRDGASVVGTVAQPTYSIRLGSGQTIVLARSQVDQLRFSSR